MVKIYLASPFFNTEQIERVKRVENALSLNETVSYVFSPRLEEANIINKHNVDKESTEGLKLIFENDINAIKNSDVVVAIHDFDSKYTDSGTAFEIGYANGIGIPVILYQEKEPMFEAPVNLMLSQASIAYIQTPRDLKKYDFNLMKKIPFNVRYLNKL